MPLSFFLPGLLVEVFDLLPCPCWVQNPDRFGVYMLGRNASSGSHVLDILASCGIECRRKGQGSRFRDHR